jgi:hypothetical protein
MNSRILDKAQKHRSARPYIEMTQTSSTIIATVKLSSLPAKLCISMRFGNVRYSACRRVRSRLPRAFYRGHYAASKRLESTARILLGSQGD